MDMQLIETDGLQKVVLTGRLDTQGVSVIETQFSAGVVAGGRDTLVDLSNVDYLASLGVRMLISTTRALSGRGRQLVLFGAQPQVVEIIETLGIDELIPVAVTESEARVLLTQ
jgi:anti-anti-sigma factor